MVRNVQNFIPGGEEVDGSSDDDEYGLYNDEPIIENALNVRVDEIRRQQLALPLTQDQIIEKVLTAIEKGDVNQIQEFLDCETMQGFNIDASITPSHWTLLSIACDEAQPQVVEFLLDKRGASSTKSSQSLETPLMIACGSRKDSDSVLEVVKILSNYEMRIDSEDNQGQTALMKACSQGHLNVVKHLLTLTASFDSFDHDGNTALMHALLKKNKDVAELLIKSGVDLNVENNKKGTALEIATRKRMFDVVELFPKPGEVYEISTELSCYNCQNMLPVNADKCPMYFPDVIEMLKGMNCEQFVQNFAEAGVDLEQLLSINDDKLKQIGVVYPFQRHLIKRGLTVFFTEPMNFDFFSQLEKLVDSEVYDYDFLIFIANLLKQSMILKNQLIHMTQAAETAKLDISYIDGTQLKQFRRNLAQLQKILMKMERDSESSKTLVHWKPQNRKGIKNSLKYALFMVSATVFLFVARRFFRR